MFDKIFGFILGEFVLILIWIFGNYCIPIISSLLNVTDNTGFIIFNIFMLFITILPPSIEFLHHR